MKQNSSFLGKLKSPYLWGNLIAMAVVVVLIIVGLKFGLDAYTHHGEAIEVPSLKGKTIADAEHILASLGLQAAVSDTGYVKSQQPGSILEQTPDAGSKVKTGRTVYLIINSDHTPSIALPDIIDNSSIREALAKLKAMGFKVGDPQLVDGEKDWVYGVTVRGRQMSTGDRISIDDIVIVQVGRGSTEAADSLEFLESEGYYDDGYYEEITIDDAYDMGGASGGSGSGSEEPAL